MEFEEISKVYISESGFKLKETTEINDIVIVLREIQLGESEKKVLSFFALVIDITSDYKKGWYSFKYTPLIVPREECALLLREPQFEGEIFTVNDLKHQIFTVNLKESVIPIPEHVVNEDISNNTNIIDFASRKKKNYD